MAVVIQSYGVGDVAALSNSATVPKPSGVAVGDLLLVVASTYGAAATTCTITGFTTVKAASANVWFHYRIADGSEGASFTLTRTGTNSAPMTGMIFRITGHDATTPVDTFAGVSAGTGSSAAIPSVTATAGGLLVSVLHKTNNIAPTNTPPSGMTTYVDDSSLTNSCSSAATETVAAGATGVKTWTTTGTGSTNAYGAGHIVVNAASTAQTITVSGIASTAAVGSPTVSAGAVTVTPTGIAPTTALGAPTVTAGAVTVTPSGIAPTTTVGTPTVGAGAVTVTPAGIAPTSAVGAPTVTAGAATVAPPSIAPTSTVGTPTVAAGAATVAPAGIGSTAALGAPEIAAGAVAVDVPGIGPTSAVGTPVVAAGPVDVTPSGIGSTAALGEPDVTGGALAIIQPEGIAPTSAVGEPSLAAGPSTVLAEGIGSTAAVGEPLIASGPLDVLVVGIAPTSTVTEPVVTPGAVTIEPDGVAASSTVGTPAVVHGDASEVIHPVGIPSTSKVGEPTVAVPAPADACWPVDLSCVEDWDDVIPGEPPTPKFSNAAKERAIAFAGMTMRMLTGYRVGGCPVTYRPCRSGCVEPTWQTYAVGGAGGVPWQPTLVSGQWLNVGCGCGTSCGCETVNEIRLPTPAGHVEQVMLDGAVFTAWRVEPSGRLVRTDGGRWPLCQNLDAEDTEPGTWSVTFVPGEEVDGQGAYAAGVLAGEYVRACSGDSCNLPSGVVTQVQRNGVTMQFAPGTFPGGRTGIEMVDAYLQRWNPNALTAPSVVLSPDTRRGRAAY